MFKKMVRRISVSFLVACIFFTNTNIVAFAENVNTLKHEETIFHNTDYMEYVWDGVKTEDIFLGNGFKVTYQLQDYWDGGYISAVTIENTSSDVIENWTLEFVNRSGISSVWNAEIDQTDEEKTVIYNAGWNQDIAVGQFVQFGIVGQGSFVGFPHDYRLHGKRNTIDTEEYQCDYEVISNWSTGYLADFHLTNNKDNSFIDWILEFDYNNEIVKLWNGIIASHEGNHYTVINADYNSIIESGGSISIGWICDEEDNGFEPDNIVFYAFDKEGNYNNITEHSNDDTNIGDNTETGNDSESGENTVSGNNSEKKDDLEAGNDGETGSNDLSENNEGDINDNQENTETIDFDIDSDVDGVPDYVEDIFLTDKEKEDTDEDGLSDYIEIYSFNLNPISRDSDNNGIPDGEEDSDGDGLCNNLECVIGTDIFEIDTDSDGLTDIEEYEDYKTNPCVHDTDGDGVYDGTEIELETNPCLYERTFNVTAESVEEDDVKASVRLALTGKQVETLSVKRCDNDLYFPKDMPGYIGGAYDFKVDGAFDSATISFEFDAEMLSDPAFDPVVYYFNENNQVLEPLSTTVEYNIATAVVEHFSTYILLNRTEYKKAFVYKDVWVSSDYSGIDVVFLIANSYTVGTTDPSSERLAVANRLIDRLPENSRIGVAKYTSDLTKLTSGLISDKDLAKAYLSLGAYSNGTAIPDMEGAIRKSYSFFEESDDSRYKMIVLFSDNAWTKMNNPNYLPALNEAWEDDIKIYSVGFGDVDKSAQPFLRMKMLAKKTGGYFCKISETESLDNMFCDLKRRIDVKTDSDGDGIPDYYEENMVMFNGISLNLDKENPDSDGDGLSDGQEVNDLSIRYVDDETKVAVSGWMITDPANQDSDHDGISDEEEILMGTNPIKGDTDGDGLNDGMEEIEGFDPFSVDFDCDGKDDLIEYVDGTSPYVYDDSWEDYLNNFIKGAVFGDWIDDTDNISTVIGQVVGSCIPLIDIRDIAGNIYHNHYGMAGLSAVGLVPDIGDVTKAAGKVCRFIAKNTDNIPKVVSVLAFADKNLPAVAKAVGKSDEFSDVCRNISKADKLGITKKEAKLIIETAEKAGKADFVPKISNKIDIKYIVKMERNAWLDTPVVRGKYIDEVINNHKAGKGLGETFPVVDRLIEDERLLVSTKSLNTMANSYQNPKQLRKVLDEYANALKNCEEKIFKGKDKIVWGSKSLNKSEYDKKVLEIVLPDELISDNNIEVFNKFKKDVDEMGMEVWYVIAK